MTRAEAAFQRGLRDLGCIVCLLQSRGYVPPAIHHMLSGGRRIGEGHVLPLCDPGHHQNAPAGSGEVSRHPNRRAFEQKYGTEAELLKRSRQLVEAARELAA